MARLRTELRHGRLVTCYADRPPDMAARLREVFTTHGEALAVVDGELRLTYADLDRETAGLAALLAAHGVGRGDRVAVMLTNGADALRAVVAVLRLGAVIVPISERARSAEVAYILGDAEPAALIHAAEFAAELPDSTAAGAARLDTSAHAWRAAVISGEPAPPEPDLAPEDLLGVLYTSGTTGRPKGAMLSHLNVVHSCLHWAEVFALTPQDRTLLCVPWAHVSGLCGVVLPFLFLGAAQVVLGPFKRRACLELAEREQISHALMVPAMYNLCLLEPNLADFRLAAWRIAAYGGAPMPEPTILRFAQAFPHLALCNCYGATETASPATIMPPGRGVEQTDSIGMTVTCGTIRVMDEAGVEVAAGETGELWISGPMVSRGYWRNGEATEAAFAAGAWRSGDVGSIDAEGFVRISDRMKDMIIRGGFKIYPAEVESVLAGLPGLVEAAVVGRPDAMLGERVVAFVSASEGGVTVEGVQTWCAARLADYKVPADVVVAAEPLPRNVNGKLQKAVLRERALELSGPASG